MSAQNKAKNIEMKEPLFREKNSTMTLILNPHEDIQLSHESFDILNQLEHFAVASVKMPAETNTPFGTVTYQYGDAYRFFLFQLHQASNLLEDVQLDDLDAQYVQQLHSAKQALTIILPFTHELQQCYQLQLSIANLLVPKMMGLIDENAQRFLYRQQVKMIAQSHYLPNPAMLFSIQAVQRSGKIWLHTHGLIRCQLTELEILNVTKDTYNDFYYLIKHLAIQLVYLRLEKPNDPVEQTQILGAFNQQHPIVSHTIPWNQALKYYPNHALGGTDDRQVDHHSLSNLIFILLIDEHDEQQLVTADKASHLFKQDPIYTVPPLEIKREKLVAHEQFPLLLKAFNQHKDEPTWVPLVKISIPHGEHNQENVWFQLDELTNEMIIGKATHDAQYLPDIKTDTVATFPLDQMIDWIIYTPEGTITPNEAYRLI